MTLDASGNLLVGTTTSDGSRLRVSGAYQTLGDGAYEGLIGKASTIVSGGGAGQFAIRSALDLLFATNGNSERARITSAGDFGVGRTTIVASNASATIEASGCLVAGGALNASQTNRGIFQYSSNETTIRSYGATSGTGAIVFRVAGGGGSADSEAARITNSGYFKASNTGTYQNATGAFHEFNNNDSGDEVTKFIHSNATSPLGLLVSYTGAAPNGTGNAFLYCGDTVGERATIRSNGGIANYSANNVALSDARLKTDITPAASYWDKIKSLEIVSFKYKDQTDDIASIGVIAQQVESVAPEFVSNEGFGDAPEGEAPYKTIYTNDMYHAAIKALQEAMTRIETLEAEVAALKGA
jgi:hypothetical protein